MARAHARAGVCVRASPGSRGSEALVQSAETIFKSLAHRQSGRLEAAAEKPTVGHLFPSSQMTCR